MTELDKYRDEMAEDAAQFCSCKGVVCHDCKPIIIKAFVEGFDASTKYHEEKYRKLVEALEWYGYASPLLGYDGGKVARHNLSELKEME